MISGAAIERRLHELATFTDVPGEMTRLTLSPAHRRAIAYLAAAFRAAGMQAAIDAAGSLVGRLPSARPGAKILLIGSHIDTVHNAGIYDGNLGVLIGLAVVEALQRDAVALPFTIELVAFGDEEGVRFPSTLTGSRALAGQFDTRWLDECDSTGMRRADALAALGAAGDTQGLARDPAAVIGYVEAHIEQGPVLEAKGLALGIVTEIVGATRGEIRVTGFAGHSGTLPMAMRHDALAAAAEMILAVETRGRAEPNLVATVGMVTIPGSAVNVVPGRVTFSFDVRAPDDNMRRRAVADIGAAVARIAAARGVVAEVAISHAADVTPCDRLLSERLAGAVARNGIAPTFLHSGAGHDAMSFRGVLPIAMLFVRCRGGVSHNPLEYAVPEDIEIAAHVLYDFVRDLADSSPPAAGEI